MHPSGTESSALRGVLRALTLDEWVRRDAGPGPPTERFVHHRGAIALPLGAPRWTSTAGTATIIR